MRLLLTRHVDNNYCGLNNYDNTNVSSYRSPYMHHLFMLTSRYRTGTLLPGIDRLTSFSVQSISSMQQG